MESTIKGLQKFLDEAHSVYHAVAALERMLTEHGYTRLWEGQEWNLAPGGKYYLIRGGSSLLAFRIPTGAVSGFTVSASHCDRPTFKLKENGELLGAYTRLAVEKYGGMLIAPWLDRPLSLAGRVLVETEDGLERRLIDLDQDLLIIPNVAIHMNRKANDGYVWNLCSDVMPLVGGAEAAGKLSALIREAAGGEVLGSDLFLYPRQNSTVWGLEHNYISACALDGLQCVWGCVQGFLHADESGCIPVLCVFDSEEVGSGSGQGAASNLLESTLTRIARGLNLSIEQLLNGTFLVSADNAHALHPNHPELADSNNAPVINGGVVLKYNANLRYATDGLSAAVFRRICNSAGVPVQTYCNRPDIPGGSTLGHIALQHVSVPAVDIGLAQLAMHSCYETAGVKDADYLCEAMRAFYSATIRMEAPNVTIC